MSEVAIVALTGFDLSRGRLDLSAAYGATIGDMVGQAFPGQPQDLFRVTIAGHVIDRAHWRSVRPKPGTTLVIRPAIQGDTLKSILTVVVTVAAVALGQFYAPALAGAIVGFGVPTAATLGIVGAGITATALVAGTLLINALVPVAKSSQDAAGSSPTLQGLRNVANPGGVVPEVMGLHRFAPPYAALPYTEIVGDDQFVVASFLIGYGPKLISNPRLGDTPIGNFADVQYEVRAGYVTDAPLTLYPHQVIEEAMTVELAAGVSTDRVTASHTNECSVDFTFPQGLVEYDSKGNKKTRTVNVTIQYRALGDTDYLTVQVIGFSSNKQDIIRRSLRFRFNAPGQYEIRCTRTTADAISSQQVDKCVWSVIRSHRDAYPLNFDRPVALACLRIRASKQLQGIVDNFNVDVETIAPDWNGSTWVSQPTNNPAALYRYALQGPSNLFPKADSEIDLAELADWRDFCASNNLQYNRVHDFSGSLKSTLDDIAGTGRALAHDKGDRWGVIIDRPRTTVIDHVSPRNSWGFNGERIFVQFPDAFRVQFLDQSNAFNQAERVVPWPGFAGDVEITEDLPLPGVTDPNAVWKEARKRQYELMNRRDTYTVSQDVESLVASRGDLVILSHDVLDRTQVAARVKTITGNVVTLDESVDMTADGGYRARFRLADGTSKLTTVPRTGTKTQALHVDDVTGIEVGNLVFVDLMGRESLECIIKSVEGGENLTATLTLVDHAPQIQALVDADIPPVWNPIVGEVNDASTIPPAVPIVRSFLSGARAISIGVTSSAVIFIDPGAGLVPPNIYEVQHRIVGAGVFNTDSAPAGQGAVRINGYVTGDHIEFQVRAQSIAGYFSGYTALDSTHTIGETDSTLLFPNDLTNAAWAKTNLTANATSALDPTGDVTATQLLETAANAAHSVGQSVTAISGSTYTWAIALKQGGRNKVLLRLQDTGGGNFVQAQFDLALGTTFSPTAVGSAVYIASSITNLGNGWYVCSVSGHQAATTLLGNLLLDNGGGTYSYLGDVTKGVFAWGASLAI